MTRKRSKASLFETLGTKKDETKVRKTTYIRADQRDKLRAICEQAEWQGVKIDEVEIFRKALDLFFETNTPEVERWVRDRQKKAA